MEVKNEKVKKVYTAMQKKRRKLLRRSLLLALFVFGVNIYAWFIFLNQSELHVEGNVASWSVTFYDGTEEVQDLTINEKIYPGMNNFSKTLSIVNDGETAATFEYSIHDLKILGKTIATTNQSAAINSLQNDYPFSFTMTADKTVIDPEDQLNFTVSIRWNFEDNGTKPYYKLTSIYDYNNEFDYYTKHEENNEVTYTKATTIDHTNFNENKLNLYLERDDVDTYFGEQCGVYQQEHEEACVEYGIHVIVKQKND